MRFLLGSALAVIGASDAVLDIVGFNPSLFGALLMLGVGAGVAVSAKTKSTDLAVR
jgi:hypothetical protein